MFLCLTSADRQRSGVVGSCGFGCGVVGRATA